MNFSPAYADIEAQIAAIDPVAYGKTRNYVDGAVTRLSPYISRGVISTKQVLEAVFARGYKPYEIEKFIQELAWRDYWQQVWIAQGDAINADLRKPQEDVLHHALPGALDAAETGIVAVDAAIERLYEQGYLHNHMRMYIAAIACNVAKSHWRIPAQWMYFHLLDGDWASNALSWQWVAGSNANKKYIANQDNINKYFYSDQKNTFLDISYEALAEIGCPDVLKTTLSPNLSTKLPKTSPLRIDPDLPTLVYNYYNLDPHWHADSPANRILLLEPSVFEKFPVSENCIDFARALSGNIPDIQVFVGEFDALIAESRSENIIYKEHPLNQNYRGQEEARDWIFGVTGYFRSFFAYWKKCKKELKKR